jgi:hypothetical protein
VLVQGCPSIRRIAAQHQLSGSALRRHKAEHLADVLVKSTEAATVAIADDLVAELRAVKRKVAALFDDSVRLGRIGWSLKSARELARLIELQAKLVGELGDGAEEFQHVHFVLPMSARELEAQGLSLPDHTTTPEALKQIVNLVREAQGVGPLTTDDGKTAAELLPSPLTEQLRYNPEPRSVPNFSGEHDERRVTLALARYGPAPTADEAQGSPRRDPAAEEAERRGGVIRGGGLSPEVLRGRAEERQAEIDRESEVNDTGDQWLIA